MTTKVRPEAPPRSGRYIPIVFASAFAVAGLGAAVGPVGALWGLLVGPAVGLILWSLKVVDRMVDLAILAGAGAVGGAIFEWALDNRSGNIGLGESIPAAAGWLVFGAALGWVLLQKKPELGRAVVMASAAGWALGAVLALQWGTSFDYLLELGDGAVEAGEVQELSRWFYIWAGGIVAWIGAAASLSAYVGTPALISFSGSAAFSLFSAASIGFSLLAVWDKIPIARDFVARFWPPDWSWAWERVPEPFIETLQIAVIGAFIGSLAAIPIAFLASRPTTYNGASYWLSRTVMNVLRTVPDLFWAMLFVAAVGFNAFAGALAMIMFSFGIMAKLFSETVDSIDPGPLEAARASGARHVQTIQFAAVPQVLPNYVAYFLYIFEINIRASAILGIVGAGGIGRLLEEQRALFAWERMMAIVIVIYGAVLIIELVSTTVRRRLV